MKAPGLLWSWCLLGLLAWQALVAPVATAATGFEVTATQTKSEVFVAVQADIDAPIDVVWAVFHDFEHSSCFVKSLYSSHASPLGPEEWLVDRGGIVDLGLFNLHLGAKYRIHLDPHQYRSQSQLISGDVKSMQNTLQLTAMDRDHTQLSSHTEVETPAWFPKTWSQSLLVKQARSAFQDMLNEVQKRAATHEATICPPR